MRGTYIPFAETADVSTTPAPYKIPRADANGAIDVSWFDLPTPPTGGAKIYGVIVEAGQQIPNLSANIVALIYDKNSNQVIHWNGSRMIVIAG